PALSRSRERTPPAAERLRGFLLACARGPRSRNRQGAARPQKDTSVSCRGRAKWMRGARSLLVREALPGLEREAGLLALALARSARAGGPGSRAHRVFADAETARDERPGRFVAVGDPGEVWRCRFECGEGGPSARLGPRGGDPPACGVPKSPRPPRGDRRAGGGTPP